MCKSKICFADRRVIPWLMAVFFFLGLIIPCNALSTTSAITQVLSRKVTELDTATSKAELIIIDHTCTDISQIPEYWLEQAKQLMIHYAHTSHGSQINTGILNLESQDPNYSVAIRTGTTAGLPPEEDPPAFRMYDGNPSETYITPGDYWDGESGKNRTRAVADTGDYAFSMWSWCGQVSSATEGYIQDYLDTLDQFETEYPDMKFIYMTGHLDGTGSDGNLHVRNEQIRNYCIANNKVLFDFADIERFDPDGTDYLDLGADDECNYNGGNWADEWCAAHPGSDLCASCSCAHSRPLNCNVKGRAFWWMMARLAGWNGSVLSVSLTPDVTVIPKGGTLGVDVTITNNADEAQIIYFATNITLPNSNIYPPSGYLFGPVPVSLNPYESKSEHLSHIIPGNAPIGAYTYHGYIGKPGESIIDEDRFDFEVIEGSASVGPEDWKTTVDK